MIYLYGLLGDPGEVDLSPLIRKQAGVRGWVMTELREAGQAVWRPACEAVLEGFAKGTFKQHVAKRYAFSEVQQAHRDMEQGRHVGKLVLVPG